MLDKKRIIKVEVFGMGKGLIVSSDNFNIIDDEDARDAQYHLMIKGSGFPEIQMGEKLEIVVHCVNGDRVKYDTTADVCTEYQLNVTLGESCVVLEERRRYYKLQTDISAKISVITRDEEDLTPDKPVLARIKNINIGGVFLSTDFELDARDTIILCFELLSKKLELTTNVIRVQKNNDKIEGYGCCFSRLKGWQEETLARYIHNAQLEQKDRIKNILNSR